MNMLPTIVIIGRRNVGKSALFNRLIEKDKAIVSDVAGTTRDRTEGICVWRGTRIRVVDTGGLDVGDTDTIDREVKKQARFAIKEADLVLFLVDARVGPTPADKALAKELRALLTPSESPPPRGGENQQISPPARGGVRGGGSTIILVANKAETEKWRDEARNPAWKRLGFGIPQPISALTGQGVGDLLDEIFTTLRTPSESPPPRGGETLTISPPARGGARGGGSNYATPDLRVAIIGKPNVGKSSLLNKILGEERVIVSPIPHTTREPQDTLIAVEDSPSAEGLSSHGGPFHILLIDTAGIRRKARISRGIEQAGVSKTLAVIERADVVLFALDGTEPLDSQDKHLAGMIEEKGVGVMVVVNKWDLLPSPQPSPVRRGGSIETPLPAGEGGRRPGEGRTTHEGNLLLKQIHFGLPGLTFAPVVFISALTGHGVQKLLPLALQIHVNRQRIIPGEDLEALLPKLIKRHKPVRGRGDTKHPVIRAIEQVATEPPTFMVSIGPKQSLHQTYLRFIENRLREFFDFEGTPIRVFARQERK